MLIGIRALPRGNIRVDTHYSSTAGVSHTECFSYDGRHRLVRGFTNNTTPSAANCTAASAGGPGVYDQTYVVDEIGNMTAGPAGATTYNTSGAGSVRPHAPTAAGVTAITYRGDGTRVRTPI